MTAYLDAMRRYATFKGRSTRSQFWLYHLGVLVLAIVGFIIDIAIAGPRGPEPLVSAVIIIAHYIPSLAIIVRRLHDTNQSGWLVLVCLIPLIGLVAFIVFGCMASTPGTNRFGAPVGGDPVVAAASGTKVERIEKLAALRASGALSDAEFEKMKADVLSGAAA
ncbi:DUF805 domain-containing protein [Aliirhizobium smilacinae]|uniref:DUF805 domain-containing protein n=1 Tax=Aliirhizobium smilacinae TaxID=1395944 RepID=A0A5C4XSA0_9HYPH|nr:DUF805 domain-containing protein [Rhizobium smilacinae]TNM66219.1 DUF805 domain-containing protein [Rhizobium smilacinae]